mmetsp:Transcript_17733/g.46364  ORF Transcript_17733/g.46364 Transcript_17733/m.46364 type:complete len:409 (-) Transcript_17733:209-1435(-)
MNFAFHDDLSEGTPQSVTFADVHETFNSPNNRHMPPDASSMHGSSSMPQLHPKHTPIRKAKPNRRHVGHGGGADAGRDGGSVDGGGRSVGSGRHRQDHSPVRRPRHSGPGSVGSRSVDSYSHGYTSTLGESTGMRFEREQAEALHKMAMSRKVQSVVHKHELRQKLAHAEYLKRARRHANRLERKEAHRRLVLAAVRVQKQFRTFLERAKINQAAARRRESAERVIFKVMIDAWLMKRAKQIKAHLQEVAELNKYATILANCWRNKQNRCAARIVLDNLRDAKDKQRERQFRRQRKDGALKVQARVRGLLTRKHAREQAEAKRKGVDQVKAAQERLQKLKGHASAEAKVCSSSIAKNAFIERLKSQKETKQRRSSSVTMREPVNKHLDHTHVMERSRSYALTALEDED